MKFIQTGRSSAAADPRLIKTCRNEECIYVKGE